jgi:DNA-binding NarL/FixJ family response regulator
VAYQRLGSIAREQARYEDSRRWHEQSRELFAELSDAPGVASAESYLCFVSWLSGDLAEAERVGSHALVEFRHEGNLREVAALLVSLGATAAYRGDTELAVSRLEEALATSRRLGYQEAIAWALHELAIVGRRQRRAEADLELMLRDALQTHQHLGDRWRVASVLEEMAGSILARRDPEAAVRLLAAAHGLRERIGTPVPPAEAEDHEVALTRLRRRLAAGAFRTQWTQGAQLDVDEAVDLAVTAMRPQTGDGDEARITPILTPRELAVLELLSQGHTNREIAAALYVSPSTAGVHVSNILRKLGAKRRVDAAGRAHALGLLPSGNLS